MSGIYGIFRYDGAPVDPYWLQRMKSAIGYYGPHGGGCKIAPPVGMGHLLLEVNPEDRFENQPMRAERGLIATTARLDNRESLLDEFNIAAPDRSNVSDGYLVQRAFDKWGEDVCSHLQGDWALAAWDAREHRLLLARDAYGCSNLYFFSGKGFIAFASSLKALLAIPGTVKEPDRLCLAEILVSWQHDAELTAYKGIRRIVRAHAMAISANGQTRVWRHWSPDGREFLRYRRNEEYEEAFLDHYKRAVQSCLRVQKPVAAELSGGRDSGSVVVLAASLLASQGRSLTAYTSVPHLSPDGAGNGREGNEWERAHATATKAGPNVRHVPVDASEYSVLDGIEYMLDVHDGPTHCAVNHYWGKAIMDAAAANGTGALLTGSMGNATVSWWGNGSALLSLLQGNSISALKLLFRAEPNPWLTMKRQILKPALTPAFRAARRFKTPSSEVLRRYSAISPQLADEVDLDGRMRAEGHDLTFTLSPLEDMRRRYFLPRYSGPGSGVEEEIAARHGIARLDPTANLALVDFLLRVPDDQFYYRGQGCWLYRRAFRNSMPDLIVNHYRKGLQAADVGHRIVRELPVVQECLNSLNAVPLAHEFLDLGLLHRCLQNLVEKVDSIATAKATMILLRGLSVGLFLRRLTVPTAELAVTC